MVILLSPSKTSNPISRVLKGSTLPLFTDETQILIQILQSKSRSEIKDLMSLSDKLTDHTYRLIHALAVDSDDDDLRCAIFNFKGDVYTGLDADVFSSDDLDYAQQYLRVLSGLYGVLRPLDLMRMYRLEMATGLKTAAGRNLYQFWGNKITKAINQVITTTKSRYLLNLASDEYTRSIQLKSINVPVIHIEFFNEIDGKRVFASFDAKKARGLMAAYVIKNKIAHPGQLKFFNAGGYIFDSLSSDHTKLVFFKQAK